MSATLKQRTIKAAEAGDAAARSADAQRTVKAIEAADAANGATELTDAQRHALGNVIERAKKRTSDLYYGSSLYTPEDSLRELEEIGSAMVTHAKRIRGLR